ncbi:MAG: hypothetical protein FWE80_02695 [Oscillospiraceae bacterium]|nr:hypothetical protein [Oscillospiraceae bacterium]
MKKVLSLAMSLLLFVVLITATTLPAQAAAEPGYYYKQLGSTAKLLYDSILEKCANGPALFILDLPDKYSFYASKEDVENELQDCIEYLNFGWELANDFQSALDAVKADKPLETFWFGTGDDTLPGAGFGAIGPEDGGTWKIHIMQINIQVDEKYAGNYAQMKTDLEKTVDDFVVDGETLYERVQSIHDQLASTIDYVMDQPYAHEATGALLKQEAVCEGYAKAFKLICDREGIPCLLIIGLGKGSAGEENHMWNYVQMENSFWYAVDVTWDSQDYVAFYDFFLVGSTTVPTNFEKIPFSASHIPSGWFSGGDQGIEFKYPALSSIAYVVGGKLPLGQISNGPTLRIDDARMILQYLVEKIELTPEQVDAAAVNGSKNDDDSPKVTITDARLILQMLVGKITEFPRTDY